MKLSISHIAWPFSEEDYFLNIAVENGCQGIEIAPNRIWEEPVNSSNQERNEYRRKVNDSGLEIVSFHALLYTRPDLGLFRDNKTDEMTQEYLKELCQLSCDMGSQVLVFGSPSNRRRNDLEIDVAMEMAAEFFYPVAVEAANLGVCFCVEPLGMNESDFITSTEQGKELVNMIGSDGFGLHLDSKAVSEEVDAAQAMRASVSMAKHFHISEPNLGRMELDNSVPHSLFSSMLNEAQYSGYVSIEMRTQEDYENAVVDSINLARTTYIDPQNQY